MASGIMSPDEDKAIFFHLFFSKCLNASAAARQLSIHTSSSKEMGQTLLREP